MKRLPLSASLILASLVIGAGLTAGQKNVPPKYKTLELKHFVLADGVVLPDTINPQNFLGFLYGQIKAELGKKGIAAQIVEDGAAVPEADAAESVVVEGQVTNFQKAGHTMAHPAEIAVRIDLYQRQGHALIKTLTPDTKLVPGHYKSDENFAKVCGQWLAGAINKALK